MTYTSIYRNSEGYYDPTSGAAMVRVLREEKEKRYRPLVYICSPYAGDVEKNVEAARNYCRFATELGYIPVAPHLFFPQFLDDNDPKERKLGLFFGNVLMNKCQELWTFGTDFSSGMKAEYLRARKKGYKIRHFTSDCREITRRIGDAK